MEILVKMSFKDYYAGLDTDAKKKLRDQLVPKYMSHGSFYDKLRDDRFTLLEIEKIESLTGQSFSDANQGN